MARKRVITEGKNAMKSWETNWDIISPIFKFSKDVRKVIYTNKCNRKFKQYIQEIKRSEKCISQ